jgi:hypothetical protein
MRKTRCEVKQDETKMRSITIANTTTTGDQGLASSFAHPLEFLP